jgi:hypothetical protein
MGNIISLNFGIVFIKFILINLTCIPPHYLINTAPLKNTFEDREAGEEDEDRFSSRDFLSISPFCPKLGFFTRKPAHQNFGVLVKEKPENASRSRAGL